MIRIRGRPHDQVGTDDMNRYRFPPLWPGWVSGASGKFRVEDTCDTLTCF